LPKSKASSILGSDVSQYFEPKARGWCRMGAGGSIPSVPRHRLPGT
jgi:hypothetical protein